MWIFTTKGFISVVDKGGDGSTLLVRGRRKGEIEALFPEAMVQKTPKNDYRFRARIDRERVAQVVAHELRTLAYDNFKGATKDRVRHDAYMEVWEAMYHYQATTQA